MSGIKTIFKAIRLFLFSNMNKQLLVFVFFLFLSGIFWLIKTMNETYEKEIKIPLQVGNIPKNVVLTSTAVDTLRVTVRDKGWVILSYLHGDRLKTMNINFKAYDRGHGQGVIPSGDIKRIVEQALELSSKTISIKPERLEFSYNYGEHKRVPVRWTGRIIPDQLYFISQVDYMPDSVDVYATQQKLDSISTIYTEALNYANFRDTLSIDCQLSHMKDVKVVPKQIHIKFYTDVLTEEAMDGVPIQGINVPAGKVLRTFPPKVRIHFVAGADRIRSLRPDDFTVITDYNEIMDTKSEKCKIYLRSVPQGISRASLETKEVDYLIEEE